MDSHDLSRGRGEYTEVLTSIRCPVLVIGIQSDVLYPYPEQEELSALLGNSEFHLVYSDEGASPARQPTQQPNIQQHTRRAATATAYCCPSPTPRQWHTPKPLLRAPAL